MKSKFLVVIERGDANHSAHSPDVPGCVASGSSVEETLMNIRSALEFHLEGIAEHGSASGSQTLFFTFKTPMRFPATTFSLTSQSTCPS